MAKTATDPGYAACPIRNIVDRFGDKWSLLVLYNLHTGGRLRFSEIHRRMTDISQKMLASTLRRLEQDGLLSRTVYPEVPPRVEYALTPRGESLMPHLVPERVPSRPRQTRPTNAPGGAMSAPNRKVPKGTFSILPFRKHKPRAVPCRSRDKSP